MERIIPPKSFFEKSQNNDQFVLLIHYEVNRSVVAKVL